MPVDQQILVAGTSAVPVTYTVPNAIEAALLCVNATIDGTGASGQFYATVEIISDGGVVVARCPCFTTIAVGGTAEISWFRLRDQNATSTAATTAYENLIFSTGGLVLYWKLDDATGATTAKDQLGFNDGTVYDIVAFQQPKLADVTSALFGSGMVGIKVHVNGIQANSVMSVEFWVKTSAVAATSVLAWADTSAPNGRWFQVTMNALGVVSATIFDTGATGHAFAGSVSINDGNTHHVVMTYGATNPATGLGAVGSIYIDGVLDTATPLAMAGIPLANNNRELNIGSRWRNVGDGNSGDLKLVGTLDEFCIYTATLTATQIANHYAAGHP